MIPKTYCAYPFVSTCLQADNTVVPCGQFMDTSLFKKILPIHEVRSSPVMNEMRRKMLNNEIMPGCQCYVEEAAGLPSMRQAGIQKFGFTTETKLRRLELVFDNVCNLKCRSCGSVNSHLWHDDEVKLYGKSLLGIKYLKNNLYDDIDVKDLEELEVLGGEPMISPGTNHFFEIIHQHDKFKDLTVLLSTNGMVLPEQYMLEGLLTCQNLKLNISIDAHGELNNYVRSGADWNTILKNLEYYHKLFELRRGKHTLINIHSAVSIYTVNVLDKLVGFIKNNFPKFHTTFQVVQFPVYLSIKNTPKSYKDQVRKFISSQEILNFLDSEGEDYFGHFINFTQQLDNIRQESLNHNDFLKSFIDKYQNPYTVEQSVKFFNEEIAKIV